MLTCFFGYKKVVNVPSCPDLCKGKARKVTSGMDTRKLMRFNLREEDLPYSDLALVLVKPGGPVSYAVVCDAPIDEAPACIPLLDAAIMMSTSFSEDHKTFYFTWHIPFHGVIWVFVYSKTEDIHICAIIPSADRTPS